MNKQIKLNIHEIKQLLWSSVLETFQKAMVEILSMFDFCRGRCYYQNVCKQ